MKHNNMLITIAIICMVVASLGWFVTEQVTIAPGTQQNQVTTPILANKRVNDSLDDSPDRLTGYNSNHQHLNGPHCEAPSIN